MPNSARQGERLATAVATSLSQEVASRLLRQEHAIRVFVRRESDICYVWTVVDEFSAEVRENIHRAEQALVADFRPAKFSFRIIPDSENLAMPSAEDFSRKAA